MIRTIKGRHRLSKAIGRRRVIRISPLPGFYPGDPHLELVKHFDEDVVAGTSPATGVLLAFTTAARRYRQKRVHDMPELVEAGPSDTIRISTPCYSTGSSRP